MTLEQITARLKRVNDARLAGKFTRKEFVTVLTEIDSVLTSNGFSWDDIESSLRFRKSMEILKGQAK